MLRKSRQSATNQRAYLAEFIFYYQQYALNSESSEYFLRQIPLPSLIENSLQIKSRDDNSKIIKEILSDDAKKWEKMEKESLKAYNLSNKSEGMLHTSLKKDYSCSCAVGETITVSFMWENALEVPLPINNIYLDCEFNGKAVAVNHLNSNIGEIPSVFEYTDINIHVVSDMSLDANEKKQLSLKITPKKSGEINIVGFKYLLCGILPSSRLFSSTLSNTPLLILVTPPMPVLEVIFHSFPSSLRTGEICNFVVEVNNKGTTGLKDLAVKCSHPSVFQFGDPLNESSGEYGTFIFISAVKRINEHHVIKINNALNDSSFFYIPLPKDSKDESKSGGVLEAQMTTLIPVCSKAGRPGNHIFNFLFLYQSQVLLN